MSTARPPDSSWADTSLPSRQLLYTNPMHGIGNAYGAGASVQVRTYSSFMFTHLWLELTG